MTTSNMASQYCRERHERKLQNMAMANSVCALDEDFGTYGEKLERVEVFKYPVQLLSYDDNDT